jgi:sec-independent protein translocase protein TatC
MRMKSRDKQENKSSENEDQEMTFWDHLEELRGVLIHGVIALILTTIVAIAFKEFLFDHIVLAPKNSDFITYRVLCKIGKMLSMTSLCFDTSSLHLINISLAGQFTSHMLVSFIAGCIVSSPYIIWKLWRFIKPGLTEEEVRHTRGAVWVITSLFIFGILFSYYLVVPVMVNFLGNYQVSTSVSNMIALDSYVGSVTTMTLLMGLIFEFPIIVVVLTRIGILNPRILRKYRKHTIIVILIVAGIITPSPDIFSQLMVSLPLYILYEISLQLSVKMHKKKLEPAG